MKNKGFTLIEIIICIVLISLISTISVVSLSKLKESNENKRLNNAFKVFDTALDVYLSEHSEIYENLNNNVEGAVITLEVLKNEGLVADNIIDPITGEVVDYKNNYYVLSNATDAKGAENVEDACQGMVGISVLKSWQELSKTGINTSDVIYICPRSNKSENNTNEEKIKELEEKIDRLQSAITLSDLGSKNWVIFDVNSTKDKLVSFSDDSSIQDLWQIVHSAGNEIKLIYNTTVDSDNSKKFAKYEINEKSEKSKSDINIYTRRSGRYKSKISANTEYKVITFTNAGYDLDGLYDAEFRGYDLIKYNEEYYVKNGNTAYTSSLNYSFLYYKLADRDLYVVYDDNTGWTNQEMFKDTYETQGSKKEILYNAINSNLRDSIIKKNYYYFYKSDDGITLNKSPIYNTTYEDVFGTINPSTDGLNDSEKIKMFLNKSLAIGYYNFSKSFNYYYGYALLSNGSISIKRTECDLYNTLACHYTTYYTNSGKERTSYLYYVNGKKTTDYMGYKIYTAPYIPVITIKGTLLSDDYNKYPTSYKEKYPSCTSDKLGSKECPRLLKLNNGYYSNGQK